MGFFKDLIKSFLGIPEDAGQRVKDEMRRNRHRGSSIDTDQGLKNIEEAVAAIFEGYEVKHNVTVQTFGAYESNYTYAHVVYDVNGTAKLAVLLVPHNGQNNRHFYNAKKACTDNNIPFVHFYDCMANEREYVENRIRTSL